MQCLISKTTPPLREFFGPNRCAFSDSNKPGPVQVLRLRRLRRSALGFTLLELLVVLGIVAVLAAVIFPLSSQLQSRAQRVQCSANLRSLYIATELFVQQNGSWPQIGESD